jgi:hypothetical protein
LNTRFAGSNPADGDKKSAARLPSNGKYSHLADVVRFYILKTLKSVNRDTFQGQIHHFLRQFLLLSYQMTAGTIARELWWSNEEFPVNIIPPWFSILIYRLGNEQ